MKKPSTRKRYLSLVSKKRRFILKGKVFHFSRKTSSKFIRIMKNNTLILRKLKQENSII